MTSRRSLPSRPNGPHICQGHAGEGHAGEGEIDARPAVLPDPDELATVDLAQLQPSTDQDPRPWIRDLPQDTTQWTWITDKSAPLPF